LVAYGGHLVLDVGAGTGISSAQLADRGADVLAVEPDARMADLLGRKGIPAEVATFEEWDPDGRQFDLVVFAASFHWVDPAIALPKVRELLTARGRLAMLWNRVRPVGALAQRLVTVIDDYSDGYAAESARTSADLHDLLATAGYNSSERQYSRRFQLSADDFIALQFTYSRFLVLDDERAGELRDRLTDVIAGEDVVMGGDTVAIIATATRD
jgi:SAM-dependent methyltransferase